MNRRSFLGAGVVAAATAAAGKTFAAENKHEVAVKKNSDHPFNRNTSNHLPTKTFGKTGYKVGILSLGAQGIIEVNNQEELSERIIHRALDLGVNYIDTAASYGQGESQRNVGRVLKYRRNETWISTKTNRFTYDEAMKQLEESLSSLQTDHIDTWQLHNVQRKDQLDQIFSTNGAIKALEKAKAEGMVRYLGITGHFEPLVLVDALQMYPFDQILLALNAADVHYLSFRNYLLPEALKQGIGIVGMKVFTRGRMITSWPPPPIDQQPPRMATMKPGALTVNETLMYNLSLPASTTIVGVDSVEQLEENLKIASEFTPLSDEQMKELEIKTLPVVRQGLYFRRWDLGA